MPIHYLKSLDEPGARLFASLTEAELRRRVEPAAGIFIAESPKVIRVALNAGLGPVALLCEERHLRGDAADIVARCPDVPVYTGSRELLSRLTGYVLTRGVLCAMRRPAPSSPEAVCRDAKRVAVLCGVVEATNVGALFRSAAALGIDAVLLTPGTCDALNRRAVRVSMGSVFLVPWAWLPGPPETLRSPGFKVAALALTPEAVPLDADTLKREPRLALVLGNEGEGLPREVITAADYVVTIPMRHGVDSLNVATAAAVAFWELRRRP